MILVGIACAFAGLCYAEMASAVPVAGSAYTYAYATMGELIAWVIGWDLVLEYAAGAATVGVGWSGHLVSLLQQLGHRAARPPHQRPDPVVHRHAGRQVAGCAHSGLNMTGATVNLPAVFIVALMSTILVIGIKESAEVNNLIVILKVAIVLLIVGVGLGPHQHRQLDAADAAQHRRMGHLRPVRHPPRRRPGVLRLHRLRRVSTAAQEAKNPQRDMPIGSSARSPSAPSSTSSCRRC
jgi:APA family basic amino acid/polyamine antiporter